MKADSKHTGAARTGDKIMFVALCVSTLVTLAVGITYLSSTVITSAAYIGTFVAGALVLLLVPATFTSRIVLTLCNIVLVGLQIHFSQGAPVFHLGIYIVLALLMVYKDPRPILFAGVVFASYPLVVLNHRDLDLYFTADHSLMAVLLNMGYVTVQTWLEFYWSLRWATHSEQEFEVASDVVYEEGPPGPFDEAARDLKALVGHIDVAASDIMDRTDAALQALNVLAYNDANIWTHTNQKVEACSESVSLIRSLITQSSGYVSPSVAGHTTPSPRNSRSMERIASILGQLRNSISQVDNTTNVLDDLALHTKLMSLNFELKTAHSSGTDNFKAISREIHVLARGIAQCSTDLRNQVADSYNSLDKGQQLVSPAVMATAAQMVGTSQDLSSTLREVGAASALLDVELAELSIALVNLALEPGPTNQLVVQALDAIRTVKSQVADLQRTLDFFE